MTQYGLKQAAIAFWRKLVLMLTANKFKRSKADPCLYFKWGPKGLTMITSVIDDMNIAGSKDDVLAAKEGIKKYFECDEVGETMEYVGLKLEYKPEQGYMKITQPVLLQSLDDEFTVPKGDPVATPGTPNEYLKAEPVDTTAADQRKYRSGVGK
jgi:Reverse transcriptase (RNA-dependent DNA polymerase)